MEYLVHNSLFHKNNKINLEAGMVISNEPGYYEKNKFGIRIENLIYVKKNKHKKYSFLKDIPDNSKVMGYPAKNIREFLKNNK